MPRRHTRLNLPPLFSMPKNNDLPKQDPNISATCLRLSRIHTRLPNKDQSTTQERKQSNPQHILSNILSQLSSKESTEGEDEDLWRTKFRKKTKTKERGKREFNFTNS
ncbi:hypothetical protein chiPu_0009335 [Chiloscyllium punctatum]|uniref:Uncharacterized protein n=1 Tax=Chiloscyllium punctatum TaxID=137246 RepID=A0A401SKH4_CHIPU|nr:hypothetical protein [Chiloscyllium punctatum]